MIPSKKVFLAITVVAVGAAAAYFYLHTGDFHRNDAEVQPVISSPAAPPAAQQTTENVINPDSSGSAANENSSELPFMAAAGDGDSSEEILKKMPSEVREGASQDDPQKQLEYALVKQFEAEALEFFPLHTIETYNPLKEPGEFGPAEGEVWVRIKVDHADEHKDIMAQVADQYKMVTRYDKPVNILLWVGGRPWAKYQYPPPGDE